MSTTFEKHLIGKEDLLLDNDGSGLVDKYSYNDKEFDITALNAEHMPIKTALRNAFSEAKTILEQTEGIADVENALTSLLVNLKAVKQKVDSGGSGGGGGTSDTDKMTEDTTISFTSTATAESINASLTAFKKNLGGHTLTLNFASTSSYTSLAGPILIRDFYNGIIIIEGGPSSGEGSTTIEDSASYETYSALFRLERCYCDVRFRNFTLEHTSNRYGVSLMNCPGVLFDSCTFVGSSTSTTTPTSWAVYYDKSFAKREGCTLTNDSWGLVQDTDISGSFTNFTDPLNGYVTASIAAHNSALAANVHSGKANLESPAFTGTPTAPSMESTETATQQIANAAWIQLVVSALKNKYLRAADQGGGSASSEGGYLATRQYVLNSLAAEVTSGTGYVKLVPRGSTSGIGICWGTVAMSYNSYTASCNVTFPTGCGMATSTACIVGSLAGTAGTAINSHTGTSMLFFERTTNGITCYAELSHDGSHKKECSLLWIAIGSCS